MQRVTCSSTKKARQRKQALPCGEHHRAVQGEKIKCWEIQPGAADYTAGEGEFPTESRDDRGSSRSSSMAPSQPHFPSPELGQ